MGPETDRTCVCLRRQGVQSSQDSHTEEKTHEDTERRRSSANQKERPQQKRTRTAPWWGLPTSRTVRKYFCCLCHPSVVLHYGGPSNKPHFTNQEGGGPHFLTDRARALAHQAAWPPLHGRSANKPTFSPDGSSKRLPEMLKCSPIQFQSIVFWNQVS